MEQADDKHPISHLGPKNLPRTRGPEPPAPIFPTDRFCHVEINKTTLLSYKPSTA